MEAKGRAWLGACVLLVVALADASATLKGAMRITKTVLLCMSDRRP